MRCGLHNPPPLLLHSLTNHRSDSNWKPDSRENRSIATLCLPVTKLPLAGSRKFADFQKLYSHATRPPLLFPGIYCGPGPGGGPHAGHLHPTPRGRYLHLPPCLHRKSTPGEDVVTGEFRSLGTGNVCNTPNTLLTHVHAFPSASCLVPVPSGIVPLGKYATISRRVVSLQTPNMCYLILWPSRLSTYPKEFTCPG